MLRSSLVTLKGLKMAQLIIQRTLSSIFSSAPLFCIPDHSGFVFSYLQGPLLLLLNLQINLWSSCHAVRNKWHKAGLIFVFLSGLQLYKSHLYSFFYHCLSIYFSMHFTQACPKFHFLADVNNEVNQIPGWKYCKEMFQYQWFLWV